MHMALTLLRRELSLGISHGGKAAIGLVFFLCIAILFPFGVGPDLKTLSQIGPAILWTGPLLSVLLGLDRLFSEDAADGSLDGYKVSGLSMEAYVLVKAASHWITATLPLIIAAPLFGLLLAMEPITIMGCFICLLVGSPSLVFFGSLGAALTLSIARSGMLMIIITIPLLIPALIFGVSASIGMGSEAAPFRAPFLLLCAFTLFSILLACFAGAAALNSDMKSDKLS